MTAPVPTMEAVLPEDRRFVAIRRRQGWVLAAMAVIGLVLLTGGAQLGLVGLVLALVVLVPALIWSNTLDLRLGPNRKRQWNDPPTFLVRADGTVGFGFAGSRQRDLRSTRELVHVELGTVTGTGVGDGFPVRAPFSGLVGALSGRLGKVPGYFWGQAVDGPALWLCFPERDWLVCTPRAAELVAYLSTLGPLPWSTRPPVPAPTPLRQGRWTAAPAAARPVNGRTEWSGVAVPLPGCTQLLVGLDGRTAIGSSPTDLGTAWRDADDLLLVELGEVSGSTPADGWSSPRGPVGVQDGPALWLCFPDQDWLLCSERVVEVVAVLAGGRSLPWSTPAATRPAPSPTALRRGRWTPSEVRVERTP